MITAAERANDNAAYANNELYVTVFKDGNWSSVRVGTTESYTDKNGRVVFEQSL